MLFCVSLTLLFFGTAGKLLQKMETKMAENGRYLIEITEIEEEFTVETIQPTPSMDLETIQILLDDRIATGG